MADFISALSQVFAVSFTIGTVTFTLSSIAIGSALTFIGIRIVRKFFGGR